MKRKGKLRWGVMVLVVGMAALVSIWMPPRYSSSPTEIRRKQVELFGRKHPGHPFHRVEVERVPADQGGITIGKSWGEQHAGDGQWIDFEDEARVALIGIALTVPGIDEEKKVVAYRHPVTLEKSAEFAEKTPQALLERPDFGDGPVLSLLLKGGENLPLVHASYWQVYDARTLAMVSKGKKERFRDGMTRLDIELEIWHDTPLLINLGILCGRGDVVSLDPDRFGEYGFGKATLRVMGTETSPWAWLDLSEEFRHHGIVVQRVGKDYEEAAWVSDMGFIIHGPGAESISVRGYADDAFVPEMRGVYLPGELSVWFTIPDLGDMPNGGEVEDLFDVKIPQVAFDEKLSELPALVAGATELNAGWFAMMRGGMHSELRLPGSAKPFRDVSYVNLPGDSEPISQHEWESKTAVFHDITPRELIREYEKMHGTGVFRVDRKEEALAWKDVPPLRERVVSWWIENGLEWLK